MNTTIERIPAVSTVFVDANIFIYHFTLQSASCARLLRRCQNLEIKGFTSAVCVAEMLHRLMIAEAIQKGYITANGAVRRLKENPGIVKKLGQYQQAFNSLLEMKVSVLPTNSEMLLRSNAIRSRYGLLINDSLIVTTMKMNRLKLLASNDRDFSKVSDIQLFKPSDL